MTTEDISGTTAEAGWAAAHQQDVVRVSGLRKEYGDTVAPADQLTGTPARQARRRALERSA